MFKISVRQAQSRIPLTIFHIQGSINLETAPNLDQSISTAYANGTRDALLDMSEVSAMTSAGLRSILMAYKLLDGNSAGSRSAVIKTPHLKLLKPSTDLREVLRIAGFDAFIDIQEDLTDAIASF